MPRNANICLPEFEFFMYISDTREEKYRQTINERISDNEENG